MHISKIAFAAAALLMAVMPSSAAAQNVSVGSTDVNFSLEQGTFKITLDSTFDTLVINSNNFVVTKGGGAKVVIQSFDKLELANNGGLETLCMPDIASAAFTQLAITQAGAVTVTPGSTNFCTTRISQSTTVGGGSSGPTVPAGGSAGISISPSGTSDGTLTATPRRPEDVRQYPIDVPIGTALYRRVIAVTNSMLAANTFALPRNKLFKGRNLTVWTYLAQVSLALKGSSCGDGASAGACRNQAKREGLLPRKLKTGLPTRLDVYRAMLIALDVDYQGARVTGDTLQTLCREYSRAGGGDTERLSDGEVEEISKIIKSARLLKLASRFPSRKCFLDKPLRRSEFIQLMDQAFKVKEVLEQEEQDEEGDQASAAGDDEVEIPGTTTPAAPTQGTSTAPAPGTSTSPAQGTSTVPTQGTSTAANGTSTGAIQGTSTPGQ